MPNKLTPFNFKIYYKKESYLEVRTAVFKYITPPYSKGLVCRYVVLTKYIIFLYSEYPVHFKFYYIT